MMAKQIGSWSTVKSIPVFAVHGALIYNAAADKWKVMLFSGGEEENNPPTGPGDLRKSYLWDPDTDTFSNQDFTLIGTNDKSDPFCAHQCHLSDGKLLVMGGAFYGGPHGQGIKATWLFNPITETWSRVGDMNFGRWYPTSVLLNDGRVFVASGRTTSSPVNKMEIYDPNTSSWSVLPNSADKSLDIYPSLHLVPNGPLAGKIIYTGTRWSGGAGTWSPPPSAVFDLASNTWANVDDLNVPNRTEGFSLLIPPSNCARILVLGGGQTASDSDSDSAEMIDLMQASPQWEYVPDMHHERSNVSAVILPNSTVFVFGGHSGYKWTTNTGGGDLHTYIGEIFDPRTKGWIETAPMLRPRQYHSVGILLPDGRVLCAGGVFPGASDQMNMEIFSPPYMDEPSRPAITSVSTTQLTYGASFQIQSTQSTNINEVVLVKPMAITHHTDASQTLVQLQFNHTGTGALDASVPNNANLLPPGYYMLFVVDNCGVPSVAKFVHIGPIAKPKEKEFKEVKEKDFKEFKEAKEFKEIKEKDLKELKELKEPKELKEKDKDIKEPKEKDKDKDIYEGGDLALPPQPFIGPELRPDLVKAALATHPNIRIPEPEDVEVKELSRKALKKKAAPKQKRKTVKKKR